MARLSPSHEQQYLPEPIYDFDALGAISAPRMTRKPPMDAHMTKVEAALLLPFPRNPAAEQRDQLRDAAGRANETALFQGLARFADKVFGWPARARLRAELGSLSERELVDIGLTRGDIDRVATGELARR